MKRKYVILEAVREVDYTTRQGSYTVTAQEIVEVTSNLINVYTSDEKQVDNEIVCNMNFMVRRPDGDTEVLDWDVHCTVKQSKTNIARIYDVLEQFRLEEQEEAKNMPEQNNDDYDTLFGPVKTDDNTEEE